MSQEESKVPNDRPLPVKFRQIHRDPTAGEYGDGALIALSEDGALYERQYSEPVGDYIWRRLPTVSSTELRQGECECCGQPTEFLPDSGYRVRCDTHRYHP